MGSYGIGVERIITAAVEQNHDATELSGADAGAIRRDYHITNIKDAKLREAGESFTKTCSTLAWKFCLTTATNARREIQGRGSDWHPYRITIGRKIADSLVELFDRQTKQTEDVKLDEIVSRCRSSRWRNVIATNRSRVWSRPDGRLVPLLPRKTCERTLY